MRVPRINLDQLVTFYFVATEKSFTAAAERLCVSQPAVTMQVRALEEFGKRVPSPNLAAELDNVACIEQGIERGGGVALLFAPTSRRRWRSTSSKRCPGRAATCGSGSTSSCAGRPSRPLRARPFSRS